jgi:hypothetical protein
VEKHTRSGAALAAEAADELEAEAAYRRSLYAQGLRGHGREPWQAGRLERRAEALRARAEA